MNRRSPGMPRAWHLPIILLLLAMLAAVCTPPAWAARDPHANPAAQDGTHTITALCATGGGGTSTDPTWCLPSGRWGDKVSSVDIRTEDAKGFSSIGKMLYNTTQTMKLALPNMVLQFTQIFWRSAISFADFAANFGTGSGGTDMNGFYAKLDKSAGTLARNFLNGALPAVFTILAFFGILMASVWGKGTVASSSKRLAATILCITALTVTSTAAMHSTENGPAKGSPWWVVQTANNAVNKMTVGLDLGGALTEGNSNLMAVEHKGSEERNCQDYLWQMHKQYKDATASTGTSSAVLNAVNQLWEETALRNWVTMQFGNPTAGSQSSKEEAADAQAAYCHVLEAKAGTQTEVQRQLVNKQMSLQVDSKTAAWIFNANNWIDPLAPGVYGGGSETDARDNTGNRIWRLAEFWETCTSKGSQDNVTARDGWGVFVNNMGDNGTGPIKGDGGITLRVGGNATSKEGELRNVEPPDSETGGIRSATTGSSADNTARQNATTDVCKTVLLNGNGTHQLHRGQDRNSGTEVKDDLGTSGSFVTTGKQSGTNIGDMATLGWRFDAPNASATWTEANTDGAYPHVRASLERMYGGAGRDTGGAIGSLIGAVCDGGISMVMSAALIMSKLAMLLMGIFLVIAFMMRAFPFGTAVSNVLRNWFKYLTELAMVGVLYSILGNIATAISAVCLNLTSGMSGTFFYNVFSGCSMLIALLLIKMFFEHVLKVRNPFDLRTVMAGVGGGALYNGLTRRGRSMVMGKAMNMLHGGKGRGGMPGKDDGGELHSKDASHDRPSEGESGSSERLGRVAHEDAATAREAPGTGASTRSSGTATGTIASTRSDSGTQSDGGTEAVDTTAGHTGEPTGSGDARESAGTLDRTVQENTDAEQQDAGVQDGVQEDAGTQDDAQQQDARQHKADDRTTGMEDMTVTVNGMPRTMPVSPDMDVADTDPDAMHDGQGDGNALESADTLDRTAQENTDAEQQDADGTTTQAGAQQQATQTTYDGTQSNAHQPDGTQQGTPTARQRFDRAMGRHGDIAFAMTRPAAHAITATSSLVDGKALPFARKVKGTVATDIRDAVDRGKRTYSTQEDKVMRNRARLALKLPGGTGWVGKALMAEGKAALVARSVATDGTRFMFRTAIPRTWHGMRKAVPAAWKFGRQHAGTAVKLGATALMLSNPITAGMGVLAAGRMLASRNGRKTVGTVAKTAGSIVKTAGSFAAAGTATVAGEIHHRHLEHTEDEYKARREAQQDMYRKILHAQHLAEERHERGFMDERDYMDMGAHPVHHETVASGPGIDPMETAWVSPDGNVSGTDSDPLDPHAPPMPEWAREFQQQAEKQHDRQDRMSVASDVEIHVDGKRTLLEGQRTLLEGQQTPPEGQRTPSEGQQERND